MFLLPFCHAHLRCLLLGLALLALPASALAANEEGVFVSNESVLLGGAARSVVADGSASWINPARLTQVDRVSVMGNVNALRLSHQRVPDAVRVHGANGLDLKTTNVSILPGSMSLAMSLSDRVTLGLGVFVTKSKVELESLHLESFTDAQRYELVIGVTNRNQDYNAVAALGWKASDRASYGVSLSFRYGRQAYTMANWTSFSNEFYERLSTVTMQQQLVRAGLGVILGANWQLRDDLVLTLVVQTPSLIIVNSENSLTAVGQSSRDPNGEVTIEHEVTRVNRLSADARALGSLRIHLGAAWTSGPILVSAEVEQRMEPDVDKRGYVPIWNARIGVQSQIKEGVLVGGGLFTDLTQRVDLADFSDTNVQYFGASLGARFTKTIHLAPEERTRTIERSTVVGARYMAGMGQFQGATIRLDGAESESRAIRYVAHELSLYMGAEFAF